MTAGPTVIQTARTMTEQVRAARAAGRRVGFVPTMGSLHDGHTGLVDRAKAACDDVVVSIYVNPTQFALHEDFDRYPRNLEADTRLLARHQVRWVFAPDTAEIYPPGNATRIEVAGPAEPFEGRLRPGHFSGVATVVCRLFQAVPADAAYFGAKDWQQTLVIRRMVADLGLPIELVVCPTVREPDGLAMSSRNAYLTATQRQQARVLSAALDQARAAWLTGTSADQIATGMAATLEAAGIEVDYAEVVVAETLQPLETSPPDAPAIALVAGRLGDTRLIDNQLLPPRGAAAC